MFGRAKSFKLASGLSLFAILTKGLHNMRLEMVEFTNNKAQHGNLYVSVVVDTPPDTLIDVNILMNDVMSVQRGQLMSGIVVEFYIDLDYESTNLHYLCTSPYHGYNTDYYPWSFPSSNLWWSPSSIYQRFPSSFSPLEYAKCFDWHRRILSQNHRVNIVVQNSNLLCDNTRIQDSEGRWKVEF